jgi:hypothetical protein
MKTQTKNCEIKTLDICVTQTKLFMRFKYIFWISQLYVCAVQRPQPVA